MTSMPSSNSDGSIHPTFEARPMAVRVSDTELACDFEARAAQYVPICQH